MNKKALHLYNKLEKSRMALIHEISMYNHEKLETPHKQGKWSVSQIFYHLNQAESVSMNYVMKKMQEPEKLKNTGIAEAIKLNIVALLFVSPIKFKMPEVLGEMPEKADYEVVLRNWDKTRVNLKQLLETIPDEMMTRNLYRQPGAGRINIYQMLRFMHIHFSRHRRQVRKAVKP